MSQVRKSKSVLVMVKAFENRPARLRAIGKIEGSVLVCGENEKMSVGFRPDCVYCFDDSLFNRMENAYEDGNKSDLSKLWNEARQFVGEFTM